jgi:hypothetical protein
MIGGDLPASPYNDVIAGTVSVGRRQWLGFRWHRHGLGGVRRQDVPDNLLLLGFQDSRQSGAAASLLQRTRTVGSRKVPGAISPDGPLVTLWSVGGAPHTHRVSQLDVIRDALAPQESDDGGRAYVDAVEEVGEALRAVVTAPIPKGDASREVADRVSPRLVQWCAQCGANHVADGLFRAAGRQAQIVLGPQEQRATALHRPPRHRQVRVDRPRAAFLDAYLRVNGPTSRTLFRDWTEGGTTAIGELWRDLDDQVRVQVDNRHYDLPAALLDDVRDAPEPSGIALVPPNDPYLRQVDRTLLLPDPKRRHEVWRPLAGPGALLVDGEVAGTWRYRRGDGELRITAFETVSAAQRAGAEKSAARVAQSTGDPDPKVIWA